MFTPYYPSSVYVSSLPTILENFRSENLAFHFGYRTSATDVREAREPVECALLGQCYGGPNWALRADKFVQYANRDFFALGRSPTAEIVLDTQSALYRALEAELVDCIGSAEEERRTSGDLAFERCPHCAGEGVIAKVQKP